MHSGVLKIMTNWIGIIRQVVNIVTNTTLCISNDILNETICRNESNSSTILVTQQLSHIAQQSLEITIVMAAYRGMIINNVFNSSERGRLAQLVRASC